MPAPNKTRVLIIGDTSDDVVQLEKALRSAGYEVLIVFNNREALAQVDEYRPDLVLPVADIFETIAPFKSIADKTDIDRFLHTVAHDLKGPIGTAQAYTIYLLEHLHEFDAEHILKMIGSIKRSTQQSVNIIQELLLVSSMIRKQKVQISVLDMANIVEDAQTSLAFLIEKTGGEIIVPESWPDVNGNAAWVKEIWINYLGHGLRHGGQPPHLEVGATTQTNGMVKFWVRDNGPGISPEGKQQTFTQPVKLEQIRAKGEGLGLPITHWIIEALGGEAGIEGGSEPGPVFYFTLPGAESDE